ncbi:hypothetical protein [Abyssisolibacter fermentans]|uniref:hypothetical protein n=1 Tax=Abyssisolibacter fermentans TaxID=1766203 RepID=UPI00083476D3|nr:hypothetical protein [Abyssisolibacter fermentans]
MNENIVKNRYTISKVWFIVYFTFVLLMIMYFVNFFISEGLNIVLTIILSLIILVICILPLFINHTPIEIKIEEKMIVFKELAKTTIIEYNDIMYIEVGDITPYIIKASRRPNKSEPMGIIFYLKSTHQKNNGLGLKKEAVQIHNKFLKQGCLKDIVTVCELKNIEVRDKRCYNN